MFRYIILSVFLLGRVKILNARPLVLNGKIRQAEKAIRGVYMTIKKCSPSLPRAAYTFPPEGADQSALHVLPDTEAYWTKDALVAATGGAWIVPPPHGWHANGLAITPNRVRHGRLICHAQGLFQIASMRPLTKIASGIICENGQELAHLGLPVLEVADINNALVDLARYARDKYKGKVIALTGSVGKTGTSYLLGQVLSTFGAVEHTRASGNSPRANACLLSSISQDIPFWVTEIALNDPTLISSFTRPHIAIVLAIGAAHLVYWKDTKQVALRKSAIFSGMEAGGYAILNRDMREYETVEEEALKKGLKIIPYGRHEKARFRLLDYANGKAVVNIHGKTHRFPCTLPPHMQMNMLAILASVHTLGYPVQQCFGALHNPELLPGRGRRHSVFLDNKKITLIDDSYNANPDSMIAALQGLCFAAPRPASRLAVLGDIAELGATEVERHLELVDSIKKANLSRLLLCGPLMLHVWEQVKDTVEGKWFPIAEDLHAEIWDWLKDGDVVMFKSSGHRLTSTVNHLLAKHCHFPEQFKQSGDAPPVIAFGGNVNIGRRQHMVSRAHGYTFALGEVAALREADLSLVSLNCVVANQGQPKVDKGVVAPTYFRARPEQLEILRQAGVAMVTTANYHSGDYGADALMEQLSHLDSMGIAHAGSGNNMQEACKPAYVQVKNHTVAIFSIDTTMPSFSATITKAGNCYLPLYNPDLWYKECVPRIAEARKKANTVLFVVHTNILEENGPGRTSVVIGRAILDAGADAVLCSSPQTCPSLEIYKERPIVYGTGDLLNDSLHEKRLSDCGLFTLSLSSQGIKKVCYQPLIAGGGRTIPATGEDALRGLKIFEERSKRFKTELTTHKDYASVSLKPQSRSLLLLKQKSTTVEPLGLAPKPLVKPRSSWILREIDLPAHLAIKPVQIGPLTLRGCWIPSSSRQMSARQTLWIESYWSIQKKIDEDLLLDITAGAVDLAASPRFGEGMRHDPCDWMWPTSRWETGVIYKDIAGLLPPVLAALRSMEMTVRFRVMNQNTLLGNYILPTQLSLQLKS